MRRVSSRSFRALLITQFLGALNDNLFKVVVSLMILERLSDPAQESLALGLSRIVLLLPFILFSAYAGILADRYRKSTIIRGTKLLEVFIMSAGVVFLAAQNIPALIVVLLLLGIHSAIFSPAKYGVLPELLAREDLSRGNGYLEFWTFMAIIFGAAAGTLLKTIAGGELLIPGFTMLLVACLGLAASFGVERTEPAAPNRPFVWNIHREFSATLAEIRRQNDLFLVLCGISFFWFAGALVEVSALLLAKQAGFTQLETGVVLTVLAVGTGCGCTAAGLLSQGKVELGLVPLGALGLVATSFILAAGATSLGVVLPTLTVLGVSAGFFIVPLNAHFQEHSAAERRGSYIAAANVMAFAFMFVAYVLPWVLIGVLGLPPQAVFFLLCIFAVCASVLIFRKLPVVFVRCLNWILAHSVYKLRVVGGENVPVSGGALLVCNHVSFVDPPLILAALERPVRFLTFRGIYEARLIRPVARLLSAIPVSPADPPKEIVRSLQTAQDALLAGELVCIFAEGAITRTGQLLPFSKGFERIMKGVDLPIVPVHIDQIWGSIFSFRGGRFFWKRPKRVPYPVTVTFGKPLPASSKAHDVRLAIQELSVDAFKLRRQSADLLHVGFARTARQRPFARCVADSSGRRLSYCRTLSGALALAGRLSEHFAADERMVGVLIPPSVGGVLANLALLYSGRVPVNLNYTAGEEALASAVRQCSMRTVITSRAVLEKLGLGDALPGVVFIEDLLAGLSVRERARAVMQGFFLPLSWLPGAAGDERGIDALATVIFSSGSTGEPKGVMLSHRNIGSNIEALYDIFQLDRQDAVLGVLPFFHSFGFTGTLWLPLLGGISAVYHPNPIDGAAIGELVQRERATILLSTPTFLMGYLRKCSAEQFRTLRRVVVGAEKLKPRLAEAFYEKFRVMPMEGYGATELSPVAMINVPDYQGGDRPQIGHKVGSVGHPLPGVSVQVVDPDTGARRRPGEDGLLLVKGPNVMLGYLQREAQTAEVIRDGWYHTGDIASIDEDGFVTILDRLSRFSKIGGEMVPHLRIEEEMQRALKEVEQVVVVTAVPDEKKGERLVVLTRRDFDVAWMLKSLSDAGLPNLWIPKRENFYFVEEFPTLGSGKLDLKAVKALARQRTSSASQETERLSESTDTATEV